MQLECLVVTPCGNPAFDSKSYLAVVFASEFGERTSVLLTEINARMAVAHLALLQGLDAIAWRLYALGRIDIEIF